MDLVSSCVDCMLNNCMGNITDETLSCLLTGVSSSVCLLLCQPHHITLFPQKDKRGKAEGRGTGDHVYVILKALVRN